MTRNLDTIRVMDLFAGCGGLSKGFHDAGFKIIVANEIWMPAIESYKVNFPQVKLIEGDIRNPQVQQKLVKESKDNQIDVIIGGPPCQGYSSSGYRNLLDDRGNLFKEYAKLIKDIRPKIFLMENVKGILSMKGLNPDLSSSELKKAKQLSLNLYRFKVLKRYMAQRELNEDEKKELNALSDNFLTFKHDLKKYSVPLIDLIQHEFRKVGYQTKIKMLNSVNFGIPQKRNRVFIIGMKEFNGIDPFPEPKSEGIISVKKVLVDLEFSPNKSLPNHVYTNHKPPFVKKIKQTKSGESVYKKYKEGFYRLIEDEPSPTVKENHGSVFVHYKEDRVLTPRELARLQSFSDNFIFKGTKGSVLKQIGNAVPPKLGQAFAEKFKSIIKNLKS
ncbi:MAG: DNA cytosine methyltransferase [Candidatus Lokiarchaeota archaeon]|nr:DNA cytosine methyltransferase [Candidatus Lokiarchaeota archaeon]